MACRTRNAVDRSRDMRGRVARGCLLVGLAACGRFGFGDAPAADGAVGDDGPAAVDAAPVDGAPDTPLDGPTTRSVTMVTGLAMLPAGRLDVGVTGTPAGFTLTYASVTGSDMFAVNLGGTMIPDSDWCNTSTGNYVGTTMTWTGALMTTMTRSDTFTFIKRYVGDLSSYAQTDSQNGVGTKPTYAAASGRWFYAVVDDAVLHLREIATDGSPIGGVIDIADGGPSGTTRTGALAGEGSSLYALWSYAPGACNWVIADVGASISLSTGDVPTTCLAPRLAVEPGRAVAVFDDGTSVQATTLTPGQGTASPVMIATGTSARIARAPAGGFWFAWQTGSELRVALAVESQLTNQATVEVPAGLQGYELVVEGSHTYLFAAAGRQLWWAKLD